MSTVYNRLPHHHPPICPDRQGVLFSCRVMELVSKKWVLFKKDVFALLGPTLEAMTDEALAAKAATGSSDHFEALVRRYSGAVYRFVYRLSGGRTEAEDIVQETFIKVFTALPNARCDLPFKPWLYKIALNTAISCQRKRKSRYAEPLAGAEAAATPGGGVDNLADRIDVQAAIDRLPSDFRQIIILRAVEELAFAEIAQVLDIPEATARTRFKRAKDSLASVLPERAQRGFRPSV